MDASAKLAMLDEAPDGVALLDAVTGRLVEANAEFLRQAGRGLDELRRIPVWQLCPPFAVEMERVRFKAVGQREAARAWELLVLRPDGTELPVEIRAKPIELAGRRYVLAASRDVSEDRTAERMLQGELDELQRLRRLMDDGKANA